MPKNTKNINQRNKYAILIKRIRQLKQQVRHLNQKNTPTKTLSTPSLLKKYANQNTKYAISIKKNANQNTKQAISIKRVTNQNTKYAISIKRIRQPKHQVRHLNQKSTPTKTPKCEFTHFSGVQFEGLNIALAYKN